MLIGDFLAYEAMVRGGDMVELADLLQRPAWMRDALCREHPEVDFFPGRGESSAPAKAVCAACAVREECGAYAATFASNELHGIWAGTSGRERRRRRPVRDQQRGPDEITAREAARLLGVGRAAVVARCNRGSLPARKDADGQWVIRLADIEDAA